MTNYHNTEATTAVQHETVFTAEDEERERATITSKDMEEILADVHGLTSSLGACRISDDETVPTKALDTLDIEIEQIADSRKAIFLEALAKSPELVDNAHKTLFLRAEELNTKLAAERLVRYWQKRHELFGPKKCFSPLTLREALKDDLTALSEGYLQLLPRLDNFGRASIFFDSSRHDKSKYSSESMLRAAWYIHHAAIENTEVQKKGVIWLLFPRDESFYQADLEIVKGMGDIITHLPIRQRAVHLCHPSPFTWLLLPLGKYIMGRRLRLRFISHIGSEECVLQELSLCGLSPDVLPTKLGGLVSSDASQWVSKRILFEGSQEIERKMNSKNVFDNDRIKVSEAGSFPASSGKNYVGRRGDNRMKEAVKARHQNPRLSLFEALVAGGFRYSKIDHVPDQKVYDEDGVSLAQRKNQLRRRLRLSAKKKLSPSNPVAKGCKDEATASQGSLEREKKLPRKLEKALKSVHMVDIPMDQCNSEKSSTRSSNGSSVDENPRAEGHCSTESDFVFEQGRVSQMIFPCAPSVENGQGKLYPQMMGQAVDPSEHSAAATMSQADSCDSFDSFIDRINELPDVLITKGNAPSSRM